MSQADKARAFRALHVPGDPLVLYNIWDAGGAAALADAGALAVATGSWSVAAAQGYRDGQQIPLDLVLTIAGRIVEAISLPVSIDFEGGYAEAPQDVAENVLKVIKAGAVGINFEDQVVGGPGLHAIPAQVQRIAAIREAADSAGVPFFLNARTDVFLKADPGISDARLMDEVAARLTAFAEAGADGFFVPGLRDPELIADLCRGSPIPVNIMLAGDQVTVAEAADLGVGRISFGPAPYRQAIEDLVTRFCAI